jgi:hypothetical protein
MPRSSAHASIEGYKSNRRPRLPGLSSNINAHYNNYHYTYLPYRLILHQTQPRTHRIAQRPLSMMYYSKAPDGTQIPHPELLLTDDFHTFAVKLVTIGIYFPW